MAAAPTAVTTATVRRALRLHPRIPLGLWSDTVHLGGSGTLVALSSIWPTDP